jgi:transcriptional regulator with GAF, ATPase, and Fis domain
VDADDAAAFPFRLVRRVGAGAAGVVFEARHEPSGARAAVKIATDRQSLLREAETNAHLARRWGPRLLDVGVAPRDLDAAFAGAPYAAFEWVEGDPLGRVLAEGTGAATAVLAAAVAHGVGRALAELHDGGVRHGDVKPDNILVARPQPVADAPDGRAATLIDLSLAETIDGDVQGGTPRYLAPEIRAGGTGGPAGDLFALGLVLAEVLDPDVRAATNPLERIAAWSLAERLEPHGWARALVSQNPGARPDAAWIGRRAAAFLGIVEPPDEVSATARARIARTYVALRRHELAQADVRAPAVDVEVRGAPRAWLEEALAWSAKFRRFEAPRIGAGRPLRPLGPIGCARWLVALVGASAASWAEEAALLGEAELASRLLALASDTPPASWGREDVLGARRTHRGAFGAGPSGLVRLTAALGLPEPTPTALDAAEARVLAGDAPEELAVVLGLALARRGELGRAMLTLEHGRSTEALSVAAEIERRRGERARARSIALDVQRRALRDDGPDDGEARARAAAVLGRLAWDEGDTAAALAAVGDEAGPPCDEVRALVAYSRGELEEGRAVVVRALAAPVPLDVAARLEGVRGMLEHAAGASREALSAFSRAADLATRAGALYEEATYRTGEAAAACDAGHVARALDTSLRAALVWERLGRPADAARAWLSRASALTLVGATHPALEAADEARARAREAGDRRAEAYALLALAEAAGEGDARARAFVLAADALVSGMPAEERLRVASRMWLLDPALVDDARRAAHDDERDASATALWEWWGARVIVLARRVDARAVAPEQVTLLLERLDRLFDREAPIAARGPALDAASRLARARGDTDRALRFEAKRRDLAAVLGAHTPPELRAALASIAWARREETDALDVGLAPAQIAQLERITRALSSRDGLKRLLEQVLDTMIFWTGVERGLLLLRAPDGRLVPRTARHLSRRDLEGEQLALSQTIARRALDTGEPVVATDATASLGDLHASVHALKLRSVLAVPLFARGESLGVVYLDDRARRGAFGARELAWVRLVASQAALAIADARDHARLRRAARQAERARRDLEIALREREAELDAARAELRSRDGEETRYPYEGIVGRSEPMRALLRTLDRLTAADVPVLLVGESGTGKELLARAIHAHGPRSARPFVSENCGAVPEPLLESTLFGHVKGAFTGASNSRAGLFEVADGGTLFLDEIGEMPLAMQVKLLRVLQDGEVRPVGGERARRVDVRIVAATHRDLATMVREGRFREDLFYRLDVVSMRIPPLRERQADIPLLVEHFVAKHAAGRKVRITRGALDRLVAFPWPGNVRQLENEIRRALVLSGDRIDAGDLSPEVAHGPSPKVGTSLRERLDALSSDLVRDALRKTGGNQTKAAELLGLSRFGLQKMMKRLGLDG